MVLSLVIVLTRVYDEFYRIWWLPCGNNDRVLRKAGSPMAMERFGLIPSDDMGPVRAPRVLISPGHRFSTANPRTSRRTALQLRVRFPTAS